MLCKQRQSGASRGMVDKYYISPDGTCMHACMDACMHACKHAWMDGCMHACMHACMHSVCKHGWIYAGEEFDSATKLAQANLVNDDMHRKICLAAKKVAKAFLGREEEERGTKQMSILYMLRAGNRARGSERSELPKIDVHHDTNGENSVNHPATTMNNMSSQHPDGNDAPAESDDETQ